MGCLRCYEEVLVRSVGSQTSSATNPDACIQSRANPFDTWITLAPQQNNSKEKAMIRQSKAEKVLGRIDRGVHLLQKGINIAQGAYQIGRAAAPYVAAML